MIVTLAHPHAGVTGEAMSRIRAEERHRQIIGMVQQRRYVSNEEFARTFGVTAQTVRRDLTRLGWMLETEQDTVAPIHYRPQQYRLRQLAAACR
jgi:predicted DNA-binding transcriptional regulator YafY